MADPIEIIEGVARDPLELVEFGVDFLDPRDLIPDPVSDAAGSIGSAVGGAASDAVRRGLAGAVGVIAGPLTELFLTAVIAIAGFALIVWGASTLLTGDNPVALARKVR